MSAGLFRAQRADASVLCGNRENVSACFHDRARRRRRKREAPDILRTIFELRPRLGIFGVHRDGNFPRFVVCQVVFVKQPAIFIDDGVRSQAGPLDVIFFVIGELRGLLRAKIVAVEIHHAIAVADEINGVAVPHGEHVHAARFGQFFVGVVFQVIDGHGQIPAAVVTLPGTEFLCCFDVSDLGAVRRKRSQVASRNRQNLGHSPLRGHQKKPREACRRGARAVRTEENVLAVGCPSEHDVVRRMKGQPLRLAAFRRNEINVRVAVVFAGEGNPLAVRRELRVKLITDMRR